MKETLDFLLLCRKKGIIFSLDDSHKNLKVKGNIKSLSDQDKDNLIRYKQDIISILVNKLNKPVYASIPAIEVQNDFKLSSSQNRIWLLSQFGQVDSVYNISSSYQFTGNLNIELLRSSITRIVARHEILRTVFRESGNAGVRQFILTPEAQEFHLGYHDLRTAPCPAEKLQLMVEKEVAATFDLAAGPLVRAVVYQLEDNKWIFTYTMHHIISDGWSMGILIRELLQYYNALVSGEEFTPEPLRIHYKDYAAWQQEQLSAESLAGHRAYWLRQFEGELPTLELATDHMRPALKTYEGAAVKICLPSDLTRAVKELASQGGATLFMGLLALVKVLLYRYTGQNDLIVGSPIAGREHTDLEDQIGFYVNTLSLRTRFNGHDDFCTLLENIRTVTMGAFEHQVYPFDELVTELNLQRDLSRNPLFDVMVSLQNSGIDLPLNAGLTGLDVSNYEQAEIRTSKFDLTFNFIEHGEEIHGNITYNSGIYDHSSIVRMERHLEQLLNAIVSDPDQPLETLPYLSIDEKHQLSEGFNMSSVVYPKGKTIIELFEAQVLKTPDHIAVEFEEQQLSYRELNAASNRLASHLRNSYAIEADDRIGILLERSVEMIVAVVAVLKSGGAYVPIDPQYPQERISYLLKDSGCKVLIDHNELENFNHQAVNYSEENLSSISKASDLAYVIYTSGSTGKPKGVMISNEALIDYSYGIRQHTNIADCKTFGLVSTLAADLGNTLIYTSLLLGATLCIIDTGKPVYRRALDCLKIVPTHWKSLQEQGDLFIPEKCLIFGGEPLTADVVKLISSSGTACKVYNHYGPTETTIGKLISPVDLNTTGVEIALGKPFGNTRIYVTDGLNQLRPIGAIGELCISGTGLARGYLNQPSLSAERFIPNPFVPGEQMYKTGDLVKWRPDGNIVFIGRKDNQVKIRGYRIELGEIENVIQQHSEIDSAAVITKPGSSGENELICYLVSSRVLTSAEMRGYLIERLPVYMIPLYFVQIEHLPLTLNGKIDRKRLPEPEDMSISTGVAYVAPRNETERKLTAIWEEVLSRDKIGIYDNFFEVGGHSLKATRLVSQIHKVFNVQLSLSSLFINPTIENISSEIEKVYWCNHTASPIPDAERVII